jgi:hypothetical protein
MGGRARVVLSGLCALAATAVLVAGCAGSSGPVPHSARNSPSGVPNVSATATGPPPAALQVIPTALVSADGRHITVTGEGGGSVASLALAARETAKVVKLSLLAVSARCPCTADLILEPVHVTLDAPLGDRRLIDAATGQTITFASGAKLATVGWLPAGFDTTPTDAIADAVTTPPTSAPAPSRPPAWARSYATVNPADPNVITITQYVGDRLSDLRPALVPQQAVDVKGHQGFSWHGGGADQGYAFQVSDSHVAWQEGGYTFIVEDDLTRIVPGEAAVLSEADVLRIARSLTLS